MKSSCSRIILRPPIPKKGKKTKKKSMGVVRPMDLVRSFILRDGILDAVRREKRVRDYHISARNCLKIKK